MPQSTDSPRRIRVNTQAILQALGRYALMIGLALLLFAIILLLAGKNPIQSYRDLFSSTLGSASAFAEVLVAMTPLLITALPLRCSRRWRLPPILPIDKPGSATMSWWLASTARVT